MSFVENITGARVKDCVDSDPLLFIVHQNEMGKAIGKKAANLRKVEEFLKRKVHFVEFSDDPAQFAMNYVQPLRVNAHMEDKIMFIEGNDTKTRGLVIGRDRKNLQQLKDVLNRFFDVAEIKVI